jgi:hypothetical protein
VDERLPPDQPAFGLDIDPQGQELPRMERELQVVLRVEAPRTGTSGEAAEVIIVDCSESMSWDTHKLDAAKAATAAALDALRPGTRFAVIKGNRFARMVYPPDERMAVAGPATTTEAKAAVTGIEAVGQTTISAWLDLARRLLEPWRSALGHALLLTDGRNDPDDDEVRAELDRVLTACEGRFGCDAFGIGADWSVEDLRAITARLNGTADHADLASLAQRFEHTTGHHMAKTIDDVELTVTAASFAALRSVKQHYPRNVDLTPQLRRSAEGVAVLDTGSWAAGEQREYFVSLQVDPGQPLDTDLAVALVSVSATTPEGSRLAGDAQDIVARWTAREQRQPSLTLDHVARQEALNNATVDGVDAYERGRLAEARAAWGRAVQLAHETRNDAQLERLQRVVEILDKAAGEVTLRAGITPEDLIAVRAGSDMSTRTAHVTPTGTRQVIRTGDATCPGCGARLAIDARFCMHCRRPVAQPNGHGTEDAR